MNKLTRLISGLLVVTFAVPAIAQVSDDDIDQARAEVNRLTEQSAELGQEVIDAYGRQAALDAEIESLRQSIEFARVQIDETETRLADLAVELYMGSTSGTSLSVLFSATNQDYPAGMEYLRQANGVDEGVVGQLRVFKEELDRHSERLSEALDEQKVLAADLEEKAGELQGQLVAAQRVYDDLVDQQQREEQERLRQEELNRQRAAAAAVAATSTTGPTNPGSPTTTTAPAPAPEPSPSGAGTCPVAGAVSFTDSWGAPRSGGRFHKGVDMIAARGTPVVAIFSGSIYRYSTSSLGGNSIYFTSDQGDLYYYAHLDSYAGLPAGQHMDVGTVIGYVGSTGNAPEYLPHLHFEYHPGGGSAVNPYSLVRGLC